MLGLNLHTILTPVLSICALFNNTSCIVRRDYTRRPIGRSWTGRVGVEAMQYSGIRQD